MRPRAFRDALALLCAASLAVSTPAGAQTPSDAAAAVERLLGYPFPDQLVAAPVGGGIAWTQNERGVRNVYVARPPAFTPEPVTRFQSEDGVEISSLTFSSDGQRLVFVKGGSTASAQPWRPVNPAGLASRPAVQVWSIPARGGAPTLLGDGYAPAVAPGTGKVAFVSGDLIGVTALDGTGQPTWLQAGGRPASLAWSPDGSTLAFISNRETHSLVGLYAPGAATVRYLAPSTGTDMQPAWSPDGTRIAFVRVTRGAPAGGDVEALPWSVWVGEVATLRASRIWKSGTNHADWLPDVPGGPAPRWAAGDAVIFRSFHDGWPHLYAIRAAGGEPTLVTPGAYSVDEFALTVDRRSVVFCANSGADPDDIDRRHLFTVPASGGTPVALTRGTGVECGPTPLSERGLVAFISSTATDSPAVAIVPLDGSVTPRAVSPSLKLPPLPAPRRVLLPSGDGTQARCQVFGEGKAGERRPAVVYVHGGPVRQMLLGWHYLPYYAGVYGVSQLLVSQGFVVVSVNYRLGSGYGYEFQHAANPGTADGPEYQDVMACTRYLETRADVDASRVAIWGTSYGGYLAARALTKNAELYAAGIVVHAPVAVVTKELGTISPGASDGSGDELFNTNWKAPTLLVHGDDDQTVPLRETIELERRLLANSVAVETLVLPGEVHELLAYRSWSAMAASALDFLTRALKSR